MIEAAKNERGVQRANAACDLCGRTEVVAAANHTTRSGKTTVDEGQVVRKLSARGWGMVKGSLHCPSCEAKRKAYAPKPQPEPILEPEAKEPAVTATIEAKEPGLRRPTPAQKRQIIGLLEDAYDDDAKRYRNPSDTDKVIAETIGGGCMWGWVAEIREELFGPDTRNAELEAVRAEVKRTEGQIGNLLGEARKLEDALSALKARLDKVA